MRSILFVAPELLPVPPTEGGAVEHCVYEVSQRIARKNFTVAVISRPAGKSVTSSRIAYHGVPWTPAGRRLLMLKQTSSRRNPLRYLAKVANVLGYAIGVRRLMLSIDADIIYVHNDPVLTLLVRKRAGQKLVLHMHNDHLTAPLLKPVVDAALARTDLVLCVSDYIRNRACGAFPNRAAKMLTVLNATDPELFRKYEGAESGQAFGSKPVAGDQFNFLYVGRLTQDKGVHVLIEAFAMVRARFPTAKLVIAGSSFFADAPRTDYQQQLANQAAQLAESIVFTGFVAHERLKYLYSAADAVVVPSTWQEPFGLVVLEAMASETCVIASKVGGVPELVDDGQTGVLVAPGDAAALADVMMRVMRHPELRDRLAHAGRQRVLQRFDYSRLATELEACFRRLP